MGVSNPVSAKAGLMSIIKKKTYMFLPINFFIFGLGYGFNFKKGVRA